MIANLLQRRSAFAKSDAPDSRPADPILEKQQLSTSRNHLFTDLFVGLDLETPLLNGSQRRYINFDNAASTPPMKAVQNAVNQFMTFYSSVHRGTGFKSQLSTHVFEETRSVVLDFFNADPREHICIFGKNTTEALNKLARRFPFTRQRDVLITTTMEHHSNDLPWRTAAVPIHVGLMPDGRLNESDLDEKLKKYADRIALVSISGASNVTGFLNPIHRIARKVHALGGQIAVDCAQLAPHRRVDMRSLSDSSHLDFIAVSAHKMYAPYGAGALIGRKDILSKGSPDMVGGGTVAIVTLEDVVWADAPDRDEAGSPNTAGAVALAAAIRQLERIGMDQVARHEAYLTAYALWKMATVPGIRIYGDSNPKSVINRLGVVPFNLKGMPHALVAAILGHEFGIGVRNGCFCAHPYIMHLLGLSNDQANHVRMDILKGDKREAPGLIRASFGLYNTFEEVDFFVNSLKRIARREFHGKYCQDMRSGEYFPEGWEPLFKNYFSFE